MGCSEAEGVECRHDLVLHDLSNDGSLRLGVENTEGAGRFASTGRRVAAEPETRLYSEQQRSHAVGEPLSFGVRPLRGAPSKVVPPESRVVNFVADDGREERAHDRIGGPTLASREKRGREGFADGGHLHQHEVELVLRQGQLRDGNEPGGDYSMTSADWEQLRPRRHARTWLKLLDTEAK